MTTASTTTDELLANKRLLICVGPGGVGKTTVAAAMGLRAACMGRKALVLTIDPARRLADALGLAGLGDEIAEVTTTGLTHEGNAVDVPGELHAAMFDNESSMDSLMTRLASDADARDRILQNRVYRAMAGSLARSHAYLAMERLHEVVQDGQYDLVILDTPPARNALDILDAPSRLATFLEEGVVKWFIRGRDVGGIRGKILQASGAAAQKLFGAVVGHQFLDETIAFFDAFYELRHGFRERAEEIQGILRHPSASFVLVSSADATHLEDARALARGVADREVAIDAVVFNRSYEPIAADPLEIVVDADVNLDELRHRLWPSSETGDPDGNAELDALLLAVMQARAAAAQGNRRGLEAIRSLRTDLPQSCITALVARLEGDVRDLEGLYELAPYFARPRRL